MKSIVQLLTFLNQYWTTIVIVIGLVLLLYKKIKTYLPLSTDEKIDIALHAIKNTILSKMTDAQIDWYGIKDAGSVKRAKVISELYKEYPILKEYINQEELIKKIDEIIDEALDEAKKIADNCNMGNVTTIEESEEHDG